MKNYQIGIFFTAVGVVYSIISSLLIPEVIRVGGMTEIFVGPLSILLLLGVVLTIFGIFNIITNKITLKNLLKSIRIFGYISFLLGISIFMIYYVPLIVIPSALFMIIFGIIKDEDFLD